MAFPTTGILDTFSDTEGPPMTGWATPTGLAGLKSASGTCLANAANAVGFWNSALSGADCEAFVTVTTATSASNTVGVWARCANVGSAATTDGYLVSMGEGATDLWSIYRVDNGVPTLLGSTFSQEVSNGDSIGIQVIGSTIGAWYKASAGSWTELATRTDSTYTAAGYVGLSISDTTGRCDNFGGGVYVPSGVVGPLIGGRLVKRGILQGRLVR